MNIKSKQIQTNWTQDQVAYLILNYHKLSNDNLIKTQILHNKTIKSIL